MFCSDIGLRVRVIDLSFFCLLQACKKLVEATKQLNEQTILIKEAIMAAFLKHSSTVKDVLNNVKEYLLEKATNFKCNDVMTQQVGNYNNMNVCFVLASLSL